MLESAPAKAIVVENSEIDVPVGPHGGRGGRKTRHSAKNRGGVPRGQSSAVELNELAVAKVAFIEGNVEFGAVAAKCRRGIESGPRKARDRASEGVCAEAASRDAGNPAAFREHAGSRRDAETKVKVARGIRRNGRINLHAGIVSGLLGEVIGQAG